MSLTIEQMLYPLEERLGDPHLLVGRVAQFDEYHQWFAGIPKRLSKSRVILARKKSGKTAFMQRLFNQLWSANGPVIPFYLEIADRKVWYPDLAINYFRASTATPMARILRIPL